MLLVAENNARAAKINTQTPWLRYQTTQVRIAKTQVQLVCFWAILLKSAEVLPSRIAFCASSSKNDMGSSFVSDTLLLMNFSFTA
jgi:hypothetical protein